MNEKIKVLQEVLTELENSFNDSSAVYFKLRSNLLEKIQLERELENKELNKMMVHYSNN